MAGARQETPAEPATADREIVINRVISAPRELVVSNTFTLEWPRGSGRVQEFPEIDRAAWFGLDEARRAAVRGQVPFLDRLGALLGGPDPG